MKVRYKRTTRGIVLGTALTLGLGVVALFAANIDLAQLGNIFASQFEIGRQSTGAETNITNIRNDGLASTGPDWSDTFSTPGDGLFDKDGFVVGVLDPDGNKLRFGPRLGGDAAFAQDDVSAGSLVDKTVYSGGPGDKNSDVVEDWTWSTSSVPAKDDVTNAYVYTKVVTGPAVPLPNPPGGTTTQHKLIYIGIEREDPSGDSHVDVEFFQAGVSLDRLGECPNGKCKFVTSDPSILGNTNGDLLADMDFTNGGGFGSLSIRRRDSSAKDNYGPEITLDGEGCNAAVDVCGFNNGNTILNGAGSTSDGWRSKDNHAVTITSLQKNVFTEIALDVTALGFGNPCFSTVQVKTRSSQSFTASLKDFTLQKFQQCAADIATEIHEGAAVGPSSTSSTNHIAPDIEIGASPCPTPPGTCARGFITVGATIHDKIIVSGTPGFVSPAGTITLSLFRNPTPGESPCSGTAASTETLTLRPIASPPGSTIPLAAVESASLTVTTTALPFSTSVAYKAVYSGDSNYVGTKTSTCEVVNVRPIPSQVVTDIRTIVAGNSVSVLNTAVANGTTVFDVATVYGGDPFVDCPTPGASCPDPGGTVTFHLFSTANCAAGTEIGTGQQVVIQSDGTNDRISRAQSLGQTPNAPAGSFLCYKAEYSGDGVYSAPLQYSDIEPVCAFTGVGNAPQQPRRPQ